MSWQDSPILNAQLPDGSRLSAVIPPVVRPAPALTIRNFTSRRFTMEALIARGTIPVRRADYRIDDFRSAECYADIVLGFAAAIERLKGGPHRVPISRCSHFRVLGSLE